MSPRFFLALASDPASPLWELFHTDASKIDLATVQAQLAQALAEDDDNDDRIDEFRDWLEENGIEFDRPALPPKKIKGTGQDDEFDLTSWSTARVDGRKGEDLVRLGDAFWEADLHVDGEKLVLVDRITGQETSLKRIEKIDIGGHVFSVDALANSIASKIDLATVQAQLAEALAEDDDIDDRIDEFRDGLEENDIEFDRPALPPKKIKGTGQDDEFDLTSWSTARVDGRKGEDLVRLGDAFWEADLHVDGEKLVLVDRITGQETSLKRIEKIDIGGHVFSVDALANSIEEGKTPLVFSDGLARTKVNTTDPTPSVLWDQIVQNLVIETQFGPTNAARVYSILHTAIYDAFAAYDGQSLRVSLDVGGDNIELHEADPRSVEEAMHHAGYTVLSTLFPDHRSLLDMVMHERLGLEPDEDDSDAALIGQDAASDAMALRLQEQARVAQDPAARYTPQNSNPDEVTVIDAWTPEWRDTPAGRELQTFLSPEFPLLEPFALPKNPNGTTDFAAFRPAAPEPFFMEGFADAQIDIPTRTLTLALPAIIGGIDYPAGAQLAVTRELVGVVINPGFIAQAEQLIDISANLSVQDRAIAEFWEDGSGTSYPPGTMMTLAQIVSTRDGHDAATDAQLFLAMGNAMLDAAIAAWDSKVVYDYARPVQAIRDLGDLGLIGSPGIDVLTNETGYVIDAFAGYDPDTGASLGSQTILARNFVTYQSPTGDFSPPFAEYVSGHSTFSGAAASVLESFTGDTAFGVGTILPAKGSDFDTTFPENSLTLYWPDFDSAAQEAGLSRLYGGIHFEDGNTAGLELGTLVGDLAYDKAHEFANDTASELDRPFSDWIFG
ncbi:vanadium-dependent haloperoxidase [Rhodobacteraceae bacterium N5(2021)]|uniref:Vanadium-dependent haloperoxidase n=1 Tax=Gymnodinialimonas phycosphaerae TaxID=2841589 RepID=A0A975TSN7_9RHOB|nr:vanadium-dependent haloperoxidase [Gymnodinialimonas phycosphaerae]MBY4893884.1 vanadium-dependent haloperoxidase [Gymnodinialimonas phycosphaerae]